MTKISYILLLFPLLFLSCSKEDKNIISNNNLPIQQNQNIPGNIIKTKADTIVLKITENISLKWDVNNNSIIKDSNYYKYLKNKNTIHLIADNIDSTTDLNIKICSKKTNNLKIGDVAFLYLWENRKFYLFKCLKLQFDAIGENCKIPENLLDYIEKNRQTVQKKVVECIQ